MDELQLKVAESLLELDLVGFSPDDPVTFKSGIISPVYIDNRQLPFFPQAWRTIIDGFRQMIDHHQLTFDAIAGIEAAGIPHSAALGYALQKPSLFVRKQVKTHGMGKQVEGGDVRAKRVLLVEDLVTTGSSSLNGVAALREAGAIVTDCLAITSYGLTATAQAFSNAQVQLHILAPFSTVLQAGMRVGRFSQQDSQIIETWLRDPHGWAVEQGT